MITDMLHSCSPNVIVTIFPGHHVNMAAIFTIPRCNPLVTPGAGELVGELLRSPGEGAQPRQRDHRDAGKPGPNSPPRAGCGSDTAPR